MKQYRMLIFITQLGFSVAFPLGGFVLLALWLQNAFQLGGWVIAVGVVLGLAGAIDGLRMTLKAMDIMAKDKQEEKPPVSFNDHD